MNRGDTPRRRLSSEESRIPVPSSPILRRSGSQRLSNFSPIAEHARNGTTTNRTPPLHRHRSLQCLSTTQVSACLSPDRDDDVDSVQSFGSAASVASSAASQCDHVSFARNGTTYSSRQKRFVVHCSPHNDPGEEYLTPTQRANRTIRKLKHLLQDKQTELIDKEREIFRLTKEVVELRLVKAASASTSTIDVAATANHDHHNGPRSQNVQGGSRSPPTTPLSRKEVVNVIDQRNFLSTTDGVAPVAPPLADVPASLVDSGHFEDLTSSSSARDWSHSPHSSPSVSQPVAPSSTPNQIAIIERIKQHHEDELREISHKHNDELREINRKHNNELREIDQKHNDELRELKENYNDEVRELKERHNDKIDSLLQRITEANDRFCELRPKLEEAENRIKVLEVENEDIKRSQQEAEEKHKTIYLQMYNKGHEAAKLESDMHQGNGDAGSNSILTENEKLLKELNLTKKDLENVKDKDYVSSQNLLSAKEAISLWNLVRKANYRRLLETRQSVSQQDPEITLNFLKSAVYYFLTDRENSQRHLSAIESILGFTDNEKMNIEKAYLWR